MKGVSIQTAAMIEGAGDQMIVTTGQHGTTGQHHGYLMVNHPTPSGCERWLIVLSDQRGYTTEAEADAAFRILLDEAGVKLPEAKR